MFIYFWERERDRQSASEGGAEREGDTESEAASRLQAVSTEPNAGLKLTNCESLAKVLSQSRTLNQLSYPGAQSMFLNLHIFWDYLSVIDF